MDTTAAAPSRLTVWSPVWPADHRSSQVAVVTANTALAAMPGNVFVPATSSGLPKDSVVNVTALITLDKTDLDDEVGQLPSTLMSDVDRGLRRVLGL
jgi:mRNA interferase MazF